MAVAGRQCCTQAGIWTLERVKRTRSTSPVTLSAVDEQVFVSWFLYEGDGRKALSFPRKPAGLFPLANSPRLTTLIQFRRRLDRSLNAVCGATHPHDHAKTQRNHKLFHAKWRIELPAEESLDVAVKLMLNGVTTAMRQQMHPSGSEVLHGARTTRRACRICLT
jgi:hypothetical protein